MPPKKAKSNPKPVAKKGRVTNSEKAGLLMPVARLRNKMKERQYAKFIRTGSAVYMAAVLEYLVAEVLEVGGSVTQDNKRQRISPRHLNIAVKSDSELDILFKDITISEGGVLPFIHQELLRKPRVEATNRESETENSE